jgi:hypothetical protein
MKSALLLLASALLVASTANAASKWPPRITDFIAMSESCSHWLGEDPYDAERAAEIKKNVSESCDGLPNRLAKLRARYSRNRKITVLLKEFDPTTGTSDKVPGD